MFCPICRAEYREGFTRCVDCGVDLVRSLPAGEALAFAKKSLAANQPMLLWTGIDPRAFRSLEAALDQAGIDYDDEQPKGVLLADARPDQYEIRVSGADFEAAKKVIADLWGVDEEEETPSAALSKAAETVNPLHFDHPIYNRVPDPDGNGTAKEDGEADEVPNDYVENFHPDEATRVVWTGEDAAMADIFKECLSNVGIGCVIGETRDSVQLRVMPQSEKRAREVVREIEEGTPME